MTYQPSKQARLAYQRKQARVRRNWMIAWWIAIIAANVALGAYFWPKIMELRSEGPRPIHFVIER